MSKQVTILTLCVLTSALGAQDWPNWRGPNRNGSTEAKNLPVEFTRKKLVAWSTELPGPGASTPIVIGDRIFLSSVDIKRAKLVALCISRQSGEVQWKQDAGSDWDGGRTSGGNRSNYASPSPASDGERVVFFFGNGDLVAFDFEGKELWRRNIQKDYGRFRFQWTFSASPTMWEGRVYLPVLQRDEAVGRRRRRGGDEPLDRAESFLLALDPKTGKTLKRHVRPSPAKVESLESYTTLVPYTGKGGRKELLLVGGDVMTGHDPETLEELWRWGTWNPGHRQRAWRLVPTIVTGDGIALVCAPKRAPVFAVKLGGDGVLPEDALSWQSKGRPNLVSTDVPTPAFHDGHFYVLSDVQNALSKVRAKDGEVVWSLSLSRDFLWRASPTVADGKVYCMNHNGEVVVVDAAKGKALHHAFLGEEDEDQIRSSVVVAHGRVFVRTNDRLWCFGGV